MTTQASKLCVQARVMNKFALLCFDVYACQGNGPLKCFTNQFQFHFVFLTQNHRGHSFTRLSIETIDLLTGTNGAAVASAITSRLCLLLKEKHDVPTLPASLDVR